MRGTKTENAIIIFFRVAIGWIFLHAGLDQILSPHFSIVPFLSHTKTFHDAFAVFTLPKVAPAVSFIVAWGQLLLGLSLISGTFIRLSTPFGVVLMLLFYLAHMDWPYNESRFYVVIGPHLIYAAILFTLFVKHAGQILGLDAYLARSRWAARSPALAFWF